MPLVPAGTPRPGGPGEGFRQACRSGSRTGNGNALLTPIERYDLVLYEPRRQLGEILVEVIPAQHIVEGGAALPGSALHEPSTELQENGELESGIGQLKTQSILPIYAGTDSLCRLPVREAFSELHHRNQRQSLRRMCRTATHREQLGEVPIVVDDSKFVSHLDVDRALRKSGLGDTNGFFGDRPVGCGCIDMTSTSENLAVGASPRSMQRCR